MKKEPSPQALTAKAIRKELKDTFPGFKFSVKSTSASMMTAVDIHWIDGPSENKVKDLLDKYAYGGFDPMTDCSYIRNQHHKHLPQVKYLGYDRDMSDEVGIAIEKEIGIHDKDMLRYEKARLVHREFVQRNY